MCFRSDDGSVYALPQSGSTGHTYGFCNFFFFEKERERERVKERNGELTVSLCVLFWCLARSEAFENRLLQFGNSHGYGLSPV